MAQLPFPITATDLDDMKFQVWEILRQVYEEKIGGAELGDVFSIPGDVLTLVLESPSGLTKTGNKLAIEVLSTGGIQISTTGLSIKILSTGGLETSASGLGIKLDGASLSLGASGIKVSSVPTNYTVVTHNTDTVLTNSDLGKIHTMDVSGGNRTFTLPTTAAAQVGYWVKLVRIGTGNWLRVQAGHTDVIWNSSAGGYIDTVDSLGVPDTHDYTAINLVQAAVGYWTTPEYGIWSSH